MSDQNYKTVEYQFNGSTYHRFHCMLCDGVYHVYTWLHKHMTKKHGLVPVRANGGK